MKREFMRGITEKDFLNVFYLAGFLVSVFLFALGMENGRGETMTMLRILDLMVGGVGTVSFTSKWIVES